MYFATVASARVAKHTDVNIQARRKSCPLPLWGSSVPEHSVTTTLDTACSDNDQPLMLLPRGPLT